MPISDDQFQPWKTPGLSSEQCETISRIYHDFVISHFSNPCFDASHDLGHVGRVTNLAIQIMQKESVLQRQSPSDMRELDPSLIILAALLHDVMDRKYAEHVNPEGRELIVEQCLKYGVPQHTAVLINDMIRAVSYTYEIRHPDEVAQMICKVPEVAIVQDADRLDATGAIGIGRCFTYNGVKGARGLDQAIEHFDILLKRTTMVKTVTGKQLASTRAARLQEFLVWWKEENGPGAT